MSGNRTIGSAIISALAVAFFLKLFVFDFMIAEGVSMTPAIKSGQILVINRLAYGFKPPFGSKYLCLWALPQTGDVVVFWTPFGDLAVKRCAGIMEGGRFMALGDNSLKSYDSRSYGPVAFNSIIGKVMGIK
jgi:signal peptidase I